MDTVQTHSASLHSPSPPPPVDLNHLINVASEIGGISHREATIKVGLWLGSSATDADGESHAVKWLKSNPDPEELEAVAEGIALLEADPLPDGFPHPPVTFDGMEAPRISTETFPATLKNIVECTAEALQVPVELAVANALAAMAIAVQNKAKVCIHEDYSEPLNLYILAALPPGERKSATVDVFKQPLVAWEREQARATAPERQAIASERRSLEKIIDSKRSKLGAKPEADRREAIDEITRLEMDLPDIPTPPRIFADDITPEALAPLMASNNSALGTMEAEGGIFDILGGRYSKGAPNIDLVLKAWGGESVLVDRRHREPPPSLIIGWAQDCAISQERALNCHKAWLQKVGVSNNTSPAIQELLDRLQAERDTEPPTQH